MPVLFYVSFRVHAVLIWAYKVRPFRSQELLSAGAPNEQLQQTRNNGFAPWRQMAPHADDRTNLLPRQNGTGASAAEQVVVNRVVASSADIAREFITSRQRQMSNKTGRWVPVVVYSGFGFWPPDRVLGHSSRNLSAGERLRMPHSVTAVSGFLEQEQTRRWTGPMNEPPRDGGWVTSQVLVGGIAPLPDMRSVLDYNNWNTRCGQTGEQTGYICQVSRQHWAKRGTCYRPDKTERS